jgi:hypothetical protein
LIWDEIPDRWVVAGALIIIASGLFVVYREIWQARGSAEPAPDKIQGLGPQS